MFGGSLLCLFSNGPFLLIHIRLEALKILAHKLRRGVDIQVYHMYHAQKAMAKRRGIDWQFNLHSWVAWWGSDYDKRGRKRGDLCMARYNDSGAYSHNNVYKATVSQNHSERNTLRKNRTYPKRTSPTGPQHGRKRVVYKGVEYPSVRVCYTDVGLTEGTVRKHLLDSKKVDCYYL